MKDSIKLLPGEPNEANREYLPEAIKGSTMVVNENGNNSQPYPERLREYQEAVVGEAVSSWYEYIPATYDGSVDVPLVVSLHGGLMTGWGQAIYTSWTHIADREGFIVLFPNASERKVWMVECEERTLEMIGKPNPEGFYLHRAPEDPADNRDMQVILALMERMERTYAIDAKRIFIHGMSMGDIMANQMLRHYSHRFAAGSGSAGMTWPEVLWDPEGEPRTRPSAVPVMQSRMEHDEIPFHDGETGMFIRSNRDFWKRANGCDSLPRLRIVGENNLAFYTGEHADFVYHEVKNRDHGQTFDDAELVWQHLFARVVEGEAGSSVEGDTWSVALAAGSNKAYVHQRLVEMSGPAFLHDKLKYHGLNGDSIVRGSYLMTPVSFIAELLGAQVVEAYEGRSAELDLPDGRSFQFAQGSIGCVLDNRIESMLCEAVYRDGELYIPLEWLLCRHFGRHASACGEVLYITDHYAELSHYMAELIQDEILR
ncbi:alpha/beta hydrolase family esterase [Paenibacillus daejeonensis]|uniref:alpha/beta hydrolase family esterase n=1 Tax=Paenibacillus daejeonensis TaxID=135193 RepID=UPI0003715238|nr:hypothetical protein [Paenibacillus daejeonensis]